MGLSGLVKGLIWAKSSLVAAGIGALIAYDHHPELQAIEYNLLDKHQQVKEEYFHDPPGLSAEWDVSQNGQIQTFLRYRSGDGEVKKQLSIGSDMLPSIDEMLTGLQGRGDPQDYLRLAKSAVNDSNIVGYMVRIARDMVVLSDRLSDEQGKTVLDSLEYYWKDGGD